MAITPISPFQGIKVDIQVCLFHIFFKIIVLISENVLELFSCFTGVATYCREIAMPICAEEGLSGCFQTNTLETNGIGLYEGIDREFTLQELKRLDSEGRAIITQHKIKVMIFSDFAFTSKSVE